MYPSAFQKTSLWLLPLLACQYTDASPRYTNSSSQHANTSSRYTNASASVYKPHAQAGIAALQNWYDSSNGLWSTTGWWNSANCLTTLANLAAVDSNTRNTTGAYVFPNTLAQAQHYNLQVTKQRTKSDLVVSHYTEDTTSRAAVTNSPNGFVNGYYDDEGWWALAWIKVYDVTHEQQYLTAAENIFEDMKGGWTTPCGGGIWWDKAHTYVNSIANELFLAVAASLANRNEAKQHYYLDWANKQWKWFSNSGLIGTNHLINDGLVNDNGTCKNNNGAVWSYNQGVVLGGLVELAAANGDRSLLTTASDIANAAIKALSSSTDGILHESCEPDCGGDASQFKGVFMRNLQALQEAAPEDNVEQFIEDNAIKVWTANRGTNGGNNGGNSTQGSQLGLTWSGPFDNAANASTQSSALDALVAAAVVIQ